MVVVASVVASISTNTRAIVRSGDKLREDMDADSCFRLDGVHVTEPGKRISGCFYCKGSGRSGANVIVAWLGKSCSLVRMLAV